MNQALSLRHVVSFFFKALFVVFLSGLCGRFAFAWQSGGKLSAYLPTVLIVLLIAYTMFLRFRGQEERSWATLAMGSSAIPLVTLFIGLFHVGIDITEVVFALLLSGTAIYLGIHCARTLSWGNLFWVVVLQGILILGLSAAHR